MLIWWLYADLKGWKRDICPRRAAALKALFDLMVDHLKKGDRLRINGLGVLEVKSRAARTGRNPATGEIIQIKASKKIAFRAAKAFKEDV
ncbi:MAG: HU family DNA-binding protein [Proteobacteria bacterium]|nr:HU family DNA-binding protein [Pseudomonadota bacterium]